MTTTITTETDAPLKSPLGVRIVVHIARILMGALFTFAGLNIFFKWFIPPDDQQPDFALALMRTGYMMQLVGGTQLFVGVLFLINRFMPFAVIVFTPLVVNIVAFHVFRERAGLPIALIVLVMWAILVWGYRAAYAPLWVARRMPGK